VTSHAPDVTVSDEFVQVSSISKRAALAIVVVAQNGVAIDIQKSEDGGGSFDAGRDQILMADFRTGNGEVIITELAAEVPEPTSLAILGAGLLCFAVRTRRRPGQSICGSQLPEARGLA